MNMKNRVVVTGMEAITPLGIGVSTYWEGLVTGRSGIDRITRFDCSQQASQIAGEVRDFFWEEHISRRDARRMDRFVQYAVVGSKQAVTDAGLNLDSEDITRIGVLIGSGIGGLKVMEDQHEVLLNRGPSRVSPYLIPMLIPNMAAGEVAIALGAKGPNNCTVTACASSSHAIGDAYRIIQRGEADCMITGGSESVITPLGVAGFCSMKALSTRNDEPERASRPFDAERDGFVIAEGAGIVVLESLEHARRRGARIYAEIVGYALNADAYHITSNDPTGETPGRCMRLAIDSAGINADDVDYVNAHGTSTVSNDKCETLAIKHALDNHARSVAISSTKSMTGHPLGAAGAIELIACIKVINEGVVPPTANLENPDPDCDLDYVPNEAREMTVNVAVSNSFGFGGHNATLVARRFEG